MSQEFPETIQPQQPEEMEGQLERSVVAAKIREVLLREGVDEEDFNVAPETREAYALLLRWCGEQEAKAHTDRERLQFEIERVLLYREGGMPKTALANCRQSFDEIDRLADMGVGTYDRKDLIDQLLDLYDQLDQLLD